MRSMLSAALLAVLAVTATPTPIAGQARGAAAPVPAGPVPRTPDGKPDLRGRWLGSGGALTHSNLIEEHAGGFGVLAGKSLIIDPPDGIIPYTPEARVVRDRNRTDAFAYLDPVAHCEFYGPGRLHQFVQEILYFGDQIVVYANQHTTRVIDMARTEHLPDAIRLWMGDSIGRWEGDTLVVDVTNFNGKTWMGFGDFHGGDAHIVERFTMVDANTIQWTMTIDNPRVFTRPWTMTSAAPLARQRALPAEEYAEESCHEHNIYLVHLKNVWEQAQKTGKR